jgi:hypothetical protein
MLHQTNRPPTTTCCRAVWLHRRTRRVYNIYKGSIPIARTQSLSIYWCINVTNVFRYWSENFPHWRAKSMLLKNSLLLWFTRFFPFWAYLNLVWVESKVTVTCLTGWQKTRCVGKSTVLSPITIPTTIKSLRNSQINYCISSSLLCQEKLSAQPAIV